MQKNEESSTLESLLIDKYHVPNDRVKHVIDRLHFHQLTTREALQDAIDWYNSPVSPGSKKGFQGFPENEQDLEQAILDLQTSKAVGRSHHDEPYGDE